MKFGILFLVLSLTAMAAEKSKMYCGTFNWGGKFSQDNIWIEDGKFNPSISSDTKNFDSFYNELGLQSRSDGDCICVKGVVKKVDYETSGGKGLGFEVIDGLFTCKTHVEIKTDIETLKKLGLNLANYYVRHETLLKKWGLRKDDTFMSVYDQNFEIKDEPSLKQAIEKFKNFSNLKFRIIRNDKVEYIDYKLPKK